MLQTCAFIFEKKNAYQLFKSQSLNASMLVTCWIKGLKKFIKSSGSIWVYISTHSEKWNKIQNQQPKNNKQSIGLYGLPCFMFLEKVAIVAASEYSAVGAVGCGNLNHKKVVWCGAYSDIFEHLDQLHNLQIWINVDLQ